MKEEEARKLNNISYFLIAQNNLSSSLTILAQDLESKLVVSYSMYLYLSLSYLSYLGTNTRLNVLGTRVTGPPGPSILSACSHVSVKFKNIILGRVLAQG